MYVYLLYIYIYLGVASVNASSNHFPCDCRVVSWISSALFANQSRDRVTANNFCISPYEVHGKTIQAAAEELALFDTCPSLDVATSEENATPQPSAPQEGRTDPSAAIVKSRADRTAEPIGRFVGLFLLLFVQCKVGRVC